MSNKNYCTKRVFKGNEPTRIVEENLTRDEAKELVQEDIESNPNAEYYMLVFDKMN
jgi:hypothetical protein